MAAQPDPAAELIEPELPLYDTEAARARARPVLILAMAMLFYQGYISAIAPIASPWIAKSFGLDQSGIAAVFAWLALAYLGALALSRMADKAGRRRVMIWSMTAMPICGLGAALSTHLVSFVLFMILLNAFGGAAVASAIVIIAEVLPIARRAQGQSYAGLAAASGSGICVVLMPILDGYGISWRWFLWIAAAFIAIGPFLAFALPESPRWEHASEAGETSRAKFYDIFVPLYRKRSISLTICTIFAMLCGEGIGAWGYFHAVSVVGLSATAASVMMTLGGGLGMIGFPAGAWSAERFGRVPTVVSSGIAVAGGGLLFFWGPPMGFAWPVLWLCVTYCMLNIVNNAVAVATNASFTELYPTALRGTTMGWFALIGAGSSLTAESTISALAKPMGGLSRVVGWLGLLAIPGAILFGLTIDETRGLSLEDAARERAYDDRA
jgi:AAHS family 3-hydroxyphenylpropionic acid transporter